MLKKVIACEVFFLFVVFAQAKDYTRLLKEDMCAYPTLDEKLQIGCPWIFSQQSCDKDVVKTVKFSQKKEKNDNIVIAQWKITRKKDFDKIVYSGTSNFVVKKYDGEDYAFWYSGKANCSSSAAGVCNWMESIFQKSIAQYTGKPYYLGLWGKTHKVKKEQAQSLALNVRSVMEQLMMTGLLLDATSSGTYADHSDIQEIWASMFLGTYEYGSFGTKSGCCESTTLDGDDGHSSAKNIYGGYYCGDTSSDDAFVRASCKEGDLYFGGDKWATLEWKEGGNFSIICVPPNFKCPKDRSLIEFNYAGNSLYACVRPPENAHFDSKQKKLVCDEKFIGIGKSRTDGKLADLILKCIPECRENEFLDIDSCKPMPVNAHRIEKYGWECDDGFSKNTQKKNCVPICREDEYLKSDSCKSIPPNAHKIDDAKWECNKGFSAIGEEKCVTNCKQNEYLESDSCKSIPLYAHKVGKSSWECDEGLSRYNKYDVCLPLPVGSEPSKGCWFSSIRLEDVKTNFCPDSIVFEGRKFSCFELLDTKDGCSLPDCLNKISDDLRGPIGTVVSFFYGDSIYSLKMKQNFTRKESMGKWSGCWKCPKGTAFELDKNECVDDEFEKSEKKSTETSEKIKENCEDPSLKLIEQKKCRTRNSGLSSGRTNQNNLVDPRDGKIYRTVKIGNQTWMAENLSYKMEGNFYLTRCSEYGFLYRWNAANQACPPGWHLPSSDEFENLFYVVGAASGKKLKARSGWKQNGNGTDSFGFSIYAAGDADYNGKCENKGISTGFWSSSKPYYMSVSARDDEASLLNSYEDNKYYVRCAKD